MKQRNYMSCTPVLHLRELWGPTLQLLPPEGLYSEGLGNQGNKLLPKSKRASLSCIFMSSCASPRATACLNARSKVVSRLSQRACWKGISCEISR